MRLRIFSDLHLEFRDFDPPAAPADVVVLAGDIGEGAAGLHWARQKFPEGPIVYVLGNHELWGERIPDSLVTLKELAASLGIHLLENEQVVIDGVRFLGATLWVNYAFKAKNLEAIYRAMYTARREKNDFRYIRYGRKRRKRRDRLTPQQVLEMHQASYAFLREELAKPFAGKTVVVTHHAPHENSVGQWEADLTLPCYVSHLPELVRAPVDLWVHGHVHDTFDYRVDGARVRTNPRGYTEPNHNLQFDPGLVIEI